MASKYWVQVSPDTQVKVTPAQLDTAVIWLDRTADSPDRPRKISDVFPERSNWGTARRRCARVLAAKGVLRQEGDGYVLPEIVRRHLDWARY